MNPIDIIDSGYDFNALISILHHNSLYETIEKVIDIGSGEGTKIFKMTGKEYWAVEIDSKQTENLEKILVDINGKHNILNVDIFSADIKEKFDLVILNNFLTVISTEYFSVCLNKVFELLNDGGILFVRVNSLDHSDIFKARNHQEATEISAGKFLINSTGYINNYFSKDEIIELLEKHNFNISVIRREDEEFMGDSKVKSEYCFIAMK